MVKFYDMIHACGHRHRYPASETSEIALLDDCPKCREFETFATIRDEAIVIDFQRYRSVGQSNRRR